MRAFIDVKVICPYCQNIMVKIPNRNRIWCEGQTCANKYVEYVLPVVELDMCKVQGAVTPERY